MLSMEIKERQQQLPKVEKQSISRQQVAAKAIDRIWELKQIRQREEDIIRGRTWTTFWDDSVKRLAQFKQRPAYKAPWQANTASNTPADKLIGILSKLAGQPMEIQLHSTEDTSVIGMKQERVLKGLLKGAGKKNHDDYQLVLEMFAAMAKGTVIGYEGWKTGTQKIREVTDINGKTGEVKVKEKTIKKWNDVYGEIVPIENFYPGNIFVRPGKIQDMTDCAMRKIFKFDEWRMEFGGYIDADKVQPKQNISQSNEDNLFYKYSEDLADDEIEQWYLFNQYTDEFMLISNNIWINPIGIDTVAPLPWNHKRLPFWAAVFEPLAEDIFYGRSLADKLMTMVDMQDAMFDRVLDQLALAIHKPILTRKNPSAVTKGFMHPGAVIQIKGSGPMSNEFSTLDVGEPSSAHMQMLGVIQQRIEQSTIASDTALNQSGGTRKTATQVLQEREAAVELVSLFLKIMEFSIRDKYELRLPNIIQFYTLPLHKADKELKFRKIILRSERLSPNGEMGTLEINFTADDMQLAQAQGEQRKAQSIEPIEIISVSPSFIRNFKGEIEVIPATSVKQTESVRQAFELNFQQVMASLYPDKVNRDSAFEDLVRVFGKDVRRLRAQTPQQEGDMNPLETENMKPESIGAIQEGLGGSLRQLAQ
jgi:hypothetical protein